MAILNMQFIKKGMVQNEISSFDKHIVAYIDKQPCTKYDELISQDKDYQTFCELSELRTGIISWYDWKPEARALEIGAGFGALTGQLCKSCSHVTVTEENLFRAQAIEKRYHDYDNLEIYVGNVTDMVFDNQFDYILMIGNLEWVGGGSTKHEPYIQYLKEIKKLLSSDGKILLAVENRLGLKYFCGAVDSHTNRAFDGLNHYVHGTKGYSFSKQEIDTIIQKSGFSYRKFYYPLPDYKLPQKIYTDEHLPDIHLEERITPYYVRNDTLIASEKELYRDIVENGVFPFFANSFLVECSQQQNLSFIEYADVFNFNVQQNDKEFEVKNQIDKANIRHGYQQLSLWSTINRKRIYDNAIRLESEEEKIANYNVSAKMKKIWKIELNMLDEVDKICKKNNLTYFLVHGSLLGALRHNGFIPWDDDLDIAMPRVDYEKFISLAEKELKEPLSIHTLFTEKDIYWGGGARVRNSLTTGIEEKEIGHQGNLGIWIDILPLDVCTMNDKHFVMKQKKIAFYQRLILAKIYGKEYKTFWDIEKLQWQIYKFISHLCSHKSLCKRLDEATKCYSQEDSTEVAFFTGYGNHRRLNAEDFKKVTYLEFEKRQVPVPCGYKNYLFGIMGKDYLDYPPEEERKPKHRGIFDPDKPYTDYTKILCDTFEDTKGKKIILFGAGIMFEDYMKKYGEKYHPSFLVDNDESKWGRYRMGIEIKNPKSILDIPPEKRKLIICSYYYREIVQQLQTMGIYEYKIYVQNFDWVIKEEDGK